MGTHKSRHNKGRKPFYKEINRDTARSHFFFDETARFSKDHGLRCTYCKREMESTDADSRVAATKDHYVPRSSGGRDVVPACRQCNGLKANMQPAQWEAFMLANPRWWKNPRFGGFERKPRQEPKNVELVAEVTLYLAKRKAEMLAQRAETDRLAAINRSFAQDVFRALDGEYFNDPLTGNRIVAPSDRDILLQLYVEKKISNQQLHAGRRWQHDMEASSIQPNASIDWSEPRGGLHYQMRGSITERQHEAMKRRREFQIAMGPVALRALDYCLDADRGRADLARSLSGRKLSVDAIVRSLLDLLAAATGDVWRVAA